MCSDCHIQDDFLTVFFFALRRCLKDKIDSYLPFGCVRVYAGKWRNELDKDMFRWRWKQSFPFEKCHLKFIKKSSFFFQSEKIKCYR